MSEMRHLETPPEGPASARHSNRSVRVWGDCPSIDPKGLSYGVSCKKLCNNWTGSLLQHALRALWHRARSGIVHHMPNGPLLTTQETAARLGVSRSTIHRAVNDGTLVPAQTIRVGANGAHLFNPDDVDIYAAHRSDDRAPVVA